MEQRRRAEGRTNFDRLIEPRAIAIVGASANAGSIGGQPLRFLTEYGYAGAVYPVNPKYPEMKGLRCYPDLTSVPQPCDIALIAVGAAHVPQTIEQCGAASIPFAIVMSAGFQEIGERGMALERDLERALNKTNVRMVGPNCLGMLNVGKHIHCGFGGAMSNRNLRPGAFAMVTQSGGFGFGVVSIAEQGGVGFNYIVSTGNETDVSAMELIEYFVERDDVEAVVAYLEGSTEGRRLLEIGERTLEKGKPVLMWKVGNSQSGRRASISHTARLTADQTLFQRAIDAGGFIEIGDTDDLVDVAQILRHHKKPKGNRVAVITAAGGAGVLMADQCERYGLQLPVASSETQERMRPLVPHFASLGNPIDVTPQIFKDGVDNFISLVREALAAPEFDQVILRSGAAQVAVPFAQRFVEVDATSDKPVVISWGSGSERSVEARQIIDAAGIPHFISPRRAIRAMGALAQFAAKLDRYRERSARPHTRPIPRQTLDLPSGPQTLGERRSKQILAAYGVPVVREVMLQLDEIEALSATPLPFPVAIKIESPDIPHKTEAGAVKVDVRDLAALKEAAREIVASVRRYKPDARIDGVLVQEMAQGREVIIGAVNDACFGPVVMFGLGGIFTEVMKDVTHRFAPFDVETATEMIQEIRAAPLFAGYRGQPALDVPALADTLARVSLLIADHQDRIAEIDINPLFVGASGRGVRAADALIVLGEDGVRR